MKSLQKKFPLSFFFFAIIIPFVVYEPLTAQAGPWELKNSDKGIFLYNRELPDGHREFRVVTTVKDLTLNSFMAVLNDTANYTQWMEGLASAKLLRNINASERLTYMVFKAPWPVSDRDSVTYTKVVQNPHTAEIVIYLDTMPHAYPQQEGKVRMTLSKGFYRFTPKAATREIEIVYQANVDPGGNLPEWAKNLSKTKLPFETMKKMIQMARKPQYFGAKFENLKELW